VEQWQTTNLRRLRLGEEKGKRLEMCANVQRDGRPAEQVAPSIQRREASLTPTTILRAVTLPGRESS